MYKPTRSIKEVGLTSYLKDTAEQHNGYAYKDLVKFLTIGVNKANIARLFNVSNHTFNKWLDIYHSEK